MTICRSNIHERQRFLGMFPVLVVRATGEDDAGSGTAKGDDAGSNRKSTSTGTHSLILSKKHSREL